MVGVAHALDDVALGVLVARGALLAELRVVVVRAEVRAQVLEEAHLRQRPPTCCNKRASLNQIRWFGMVKDGSAGLGWFSWFEMVQLVWDASVS